MNYLDLIITVVLLFSIYQGFKRGFVIGVLGFGSTLASFYLALRLFSPLATWIISQWQTNSAITPLIVFLVCILVLEIIGTLIISFIDGAILQTVYKVKVIKITDQIFGIVPSLLITLLFVGLFLLIPIMVPVSPKLRSHTQQSWFGKQLLPQMYTYMPKVEQLARALPTQSLLYLVPRSPSSDESVPLSIPQSLSLQPDPQSEAVMLTLINKERTAVGLAPLTRRDEVIPVARAHSQDMFQRRYFSHNNPEGKSPFDRMEEAKIGFLIAGENLAYAPDVEIAHRGLMNSQGHRENILRPEFKQVGIGVIDSGLYGKMFTQNFTD